MAVYPTMILPKRGKAFVSVVVAVLVALSLFLPLLGPSRVSFEASSSSLQSSSSHDPLADIQNSTLGFGSLILLSLPSRTDRRDAVTLIADHTNITITKVIDGVRTEDIDERAYPFGPGLDKLLTEKYHAYLGSWRSHMDIFRYIVENRIESALIFEDDIDWDINIKSQLTFFAQSLRMSPLRRPYSTYELQHAPYGLDWDMIHFASSEIRLAPPPRDKAYVTYQDPYRGDLETVNNGCTGKYFCWKPLLRSTDAWDNKRSIVPTYNSVGLSAFAVTYRGAKRLLYYLSYKELTDTLDRSIANLFMNGDLHGWSVIPPMMSEWKLDGKKDTNLRVLAADHQPGLGNMEGHSAGLSQSVRKQMARDLEIDDYWENEKDHWSLVNNNPPPAPVPAP
ncbi:hypothetical protein BZA70DRAFT_166579 [Myxozyma melibiosi]|uniref:Glycosyl transferase family 25 domain-containing protein n=1 Tax=Myxozyma melibiosi TaxID=54550 RepID=A0ABR1F4Z8_9ASCO